MLAMSNIAMARASLLPKQGKTLENLVPKGWVILRKAHGDLNGDGAKDLAFVIQGTDPQNIKGKQSDNDGIINHNPRILAIYFADKKSGAYQKQRQLDTFIPLLDDHSMDEPFSEFKISDEALHIGFHFWSTSGRDTAEYHFRFRYDKNSFQLIRLELSKSNRSSGNTSDHQFDFISRKLTVSKGNFSQDDPTSVVHEKIPLKKLKTLKFIAKSSAWVFLDVDFYQVK